MLRRLGLVFYVLAVILIVSDLLGMGIFVTNTDSFFVAAILTLLGFVFAGNPLKEAE